MTQEAPHVTKKTSIKGMPTAGRITTHMTPMMPKAQLHAGGQETQQRIASSESPRAGPMQGTQSAAIPKGPPMRLNANQRTRKPTMRKIIVIASDSACKSLKNTSLSTVPVRNFAMEKPEQSHELEAVQRLMTPPWFSPSTVTMGLLQSVPLKLTRTRPMLWLSPPTTHLSDIYVEVLFKDQPEGVLDARTGVFNGTIRTYSPSMVNAPTSTLGAY
mmetsp:Transcript_135416/g.337847  ORF Transcript_135416/g.337847 Transcript_135416/m.337847 type:complete len:216 (-) Transcript_135416:119-766(-)